MIKVALFVLTLAVANALPLNDSDPTIDPVSRVKKDLEKMSDEVQSAKNKTAAEPKAAAPGVYAPAALFPAAYSQFAFPSVYQTPAAFPYYPAAAANSYYSAAAPAAFASNVAAIPAATYHVPSPYALPLTAAAVAAAPQPSIFTSYMYRDQQQQQQQQPKESKTPNPADGKTLHRLLRTGPAYAPSYYQAQPQYYSSPVSGYQYHESLPAVAAIQPVTYAAVPEYGSEAYYNYYRSQNANKNYGMSSSVPGQYAPMARDASSVHDTGDVYDSFSQLAYDGGFGQIDDLRQQDAQNNRPSYQFEQLSLPRSMPLSRIANEPSLDDHQRWGYGSPAAAANNLPIPSPNAEDQVYVVMNPYDFNQNAQSKNADYYTHLYPNVDMMAPVNAYQATHLVRTTSSLPPFAHSNIAAQMHSFWNNMFRQSLEAENKRMSGSKTADDKKKAETDELYRKISHVFNFEGKSNEAKDMIKETMSKDDAKKSDEKSEKKQ